MNQQYTSPFAQHFYHMDQQLQNMQHMLNQMKTQFTSYNQPMYNQNAGAVPSLMIADITAADEESLNVTTLNQSTPPQTTRINREEFLRIMSNQGNTSGQLARVVCSGASMHGARAWILTDNQAVLSVVNLGSGLFDIAFVSTLPGVAISDVRSQKPKQEQPNPYRDSFFGRRATETSQLNWVSDLKITDDGLLEVSTVNYNDPTPKTMFMPLPKLIEMLQPDAARMQAAANPTENASKVWIIADDLAILSIVTLGSVVIHPENLQQFQGNVVVEDLRKKATVEEETDEPSWVTDLTYDDTAGWNVTMSNFAMETNPNSFYRGPTIKETKQLMSLEDLQNLNTSGEWGALQLDFAITNMKPESLVAWKLNDAYVMLTVPTIGSGVYDIEVLADLDGIKVIDVSSAKVEEPQTNDYVYNRNERRHMLDSFIIEGVENVKDGDRYNNHYKLSFKHQHGTVNTYIPKKDLSHMLVAEFDTITAQGLAAMVRRQNKPNSPKITFTVVHFENNGQSIVQTLPAGMGVPVTYFLATESVRKHMAKLEDDTYLRQFEV